MSNAGPTADANATHTAVPSLRTNKRCNHYNDLKMADDYTLMTTESMALVLNDDGCCIRHPSIRLKEYDDNGDVFLKQACPQCQEEFQSTQDALLKKRRELNSQLHELQEEETPRMNGRRKGVDNVPAIPKPPPAIMAEGLSLESLAAHMSHIQQMQDILMIQKDKEISELKSKVEALQSQVTEKEIENVLLQERMTTQKQDMERELQFIKKAVAMDRKRRMKGGGGQEIRIEQLHVHHIPNESPKEIHDAAALATQQYLDGKAKEAEESPRTYNKSNIPLGITSVDTTPATTNCRTAVAAGGGEMNDMLKKLQEQDRAKKSPAVVGDIHFIPTATCDIHFIPTAKEEEEVISESRVKAMAAKLDTTKDVEFVPAGARSPAHFKPKDRVESDEEEDESDESAQIGSHGKIPPLTRKPTPTPVSFQSKPGPLTMMQRVPLDNPNEHRKDPLNDSRQSLRPPGKLQPASSTIPTMQERATRATSRAPIAEFEFDLYAPKTVPSSEPVTVSSDFETSDRFLRRILDGHEDVGSIGHSTVGPTVASTTFGEDRRVVKDQLVSDPYGDKGIYTGEVLLSTGLPHGEGKMIYQDLGRTYEGESY